MIPFSTICSFISVAMYQVLGLPISKILTKSDRYFKVLITCVRWDMLMLQIRAVIDLIYDKSVIKASHLY